MLEILIEEHKFYDINNIKTLKRKLVPEGIIRFGELKLYVSECRTSFGEG